MRKLGQTPEKIFAGAKKLIPYPKKCGKAP